MMIKKYIRKHDYLDPVSLTIIPLIVCWSQGKVVIKKALDCSSAFVYRVEMRSMLYTGVAVNDPPFITDSLYLVPLGECIMIP